METGGSKSAALQAVGFARGPNKVSCPDSIDTPSNLWDAIEDDHDHDHDRLLMLQNIVTGERGDAKCAPGASGFWFYGDLGVTSRLRVFFQEIENQT